MAEMIQDIQFKRGTRVNLELVLKNDNKPKAGEPVFELDTGKMKIGDGLKDYADLPYFGNGSEVEEQIIFLNRSEFPAEGETNKLYIAKDTNLSYIWKFNKYELISVDVIDGGDASDWL